MNRWPAFGIAFFMLMLFGCGETGDRSIASPAGEAITGLTLAKADVTPLAAGEAYVATLESPDRATLAARLDGRVARLMVRAGERVEEGQLLAVIADHGAAEGRREAEGALTEARKAAAAAEARLRLTEQTEARYRRLFEREALTAQEFDKVRAELEEARQLEAAAQAAIARAAAARDGADVTLGHSRIKAPYAGVVVALLIKEGGTVFPGAPLFTLDRVGRTLARVDLPESLAARIALGSAFTVEIPALGREVAGSVRELIPAADPASRTFQVKIELATDEPLPAGLFARVRPHGDDTVALLVPRAALVRRGQLDGIYVVEEGILRYRLARTGRVVGDQVEILSGLRTGETLVVKGVARAKHGARVED
ncbi:efflux RND transporter periplasmic adaptor subunit [Trichloromonas sp.]|uniref:efflux RND transporter periplasmic adaptor subunit n=1 Tax=Trichloromonas sp. TaxID=3069249 RepID=UPI002A3F2540|nr:efflux RND transporter periplasmic adaptor subunit [Trichloromonas sp.]